MAIGAGGAAAITAAGSVLGAGINAGSQGKMNRKTREWNTRMWQLQQFQNLNNFNLQKDYEQSLFDRDSAYMEGLWNKQNKYNEELWQKQNEYYEGLWNMENMYNSPAAQMQRYKEAGLNPNLIYGQSNTAGGISSSPQQTAPHPSAKSSGQAKLEKSEAKSWNPTAPHLDIATGLSAYFSARESQARTNNLEEQNNVLIEEARLKAASTLKTLEDTSMSSFQRKLAEETRTMTIEGIRESLRKTKLQNMNLGIDFSQKELDFNWQKQLREFGVQPSDNLFLRMLLMKGKDLYEGVENEVNKGKYFRRSRK